MENSSSIIFRNIPQISTIINLPFNQVGIEKFHYLLFKQQSALMIFLSLPDFAAAFELGGHG